MFRIAQHVHLADLLYQTITLVLLRKTHDDAAIPHLLPSVIRQLFCVEIRDMQVSIMIRYFGQIERTVPQPITIQTAHSSSALSRTKRDVLRYTTNMKRVSYLV